MERIDNAMRVHHSHEILVPTNLWQQQQLQECMQQPPQPQSHHQQEGMQQPSSSSSSSDYNEHHHHQPSHLRAHPTHDNIPVSHHQDDDTLDTSIMGHTYGNNMTNTSGRTSGVHSMHHSKRNHFLSEDSSGVDPYMMMQPSYSTRNNPTNRNNHSVISVSSSSLSSKSQLIEVEEEEERQLLRLLTNPTEASQEMVATTMGSDIAWNQLWCFATVAVWLSRREDDCCAHMDDQGNTSGMGDKKER